MRLSVWEKSVEQTDGMVMIGHGTGKRVVEGVIPFAGMRALVAARSADQTVFPRDGGQNKFRRRKVAGSVIGAEVFLERVFS